LRLSAAVPAATAALVAEARSALAKQRTSASRDPSLLSDDLLPLVRRIVPGVAGKVWLELFGDGVGPARRYLPVEGDRVVEGFVELPPHIVPLFVGDSIVIGAMSVPEGGTSLIGLRVK